MVNLLYFLFKMYLIHAHKILIHFWIQMNVFIDLLTKKIAFIERKLFFKLSVMSLNIIYFSRYLF